MNLATGNESLPVIDADQKETLCARALEAEWSRSEFQRGTISEDETWACWVRDFLQRHTKMSGTLQRYESSWFELQGFLRQNSINRPRDLTYQHCLAYLQWRTAKTRKASKKPISLNTALHDIKVLRLIMRQAVRLGYATGNPVDRLGVAKVETKRKPEFSDNDIAAIRSQLEQEAEWMKTSFEIALHTGCRQRETVIDFSQIDFERKTITFDNPKGGRTRAFTVPLPAALEPMLRAIRASGAPRTLNMPKVPGVRWWEFFNEKMKRSDWCFHCTRVTFVTRLFRAGVPTSAAMKLVNHSTLLVHQVYQRLSVEDVRQWADLVSLPTNAVLLPDNSE